MANFEQDFLDRYLERGLGSMPKSDIDALIMHLLDTRHVNGSPPLASYSNQTVSQRLKTPVSKIKRLRYEAALKFGNSIEEEAMGRLLAALCKATFEPKKEQICLIIEDNLAKNWLQDQLKIYGHIFDHPFNTEIIRVSASGLFEVLGSIFSDKALERFKTDFESATRKKTDEARTRAFKAIAKRFADGAAEAAGKSVVTVLKAHLLPA